MIEAPHLTPSGTTKATVARLRPLSGLGRFGPQISLLICTLLLTVSGFGVTRSPALYAQSVSVDNPDLPAVCGLNIVLVLDESGSLQPFAATVRASVHTLLEALADTGSQVALIEFNDDARLPLPAGPDYHPVTSGQGGTISPGGIFDDYLAHGYVPNGFTNWDAALALVAEVNNNNGPAPMVIMVTDNHPTVYTNSFGSIVGGNDAQALAEAVTQANLVKTQGSHLFAIGVGNITNELPFVAISGPERYPDGESSFSRADYMLTDFAQLATALRQIVFGLCGPSVTVTKYLDQGAGSVPLAGQTFTGAVQISEVGAPSAGFVWLMPTNGAAQSRAVSTGNDGTAQWQWVPGTLQSPQAWNSAFTLTESPQLGTIFESATCIRKTFDPPTGFTSSGFALTTLPATFIVGDNDLITCDVHNARVALLVQKTANPATVPESGAPVTFDFAVTNTGSAPVAVASLIDNRFGDLNGQGSCVADGSVTLAPSLTYRCAITKMIAGNRGLPHTNVITATVRATTGETATATDAATVTFYDARPQATLGRTVTPATVNEPGGLVKHTVTVHNQSLGEPLTLTALTDIPFGNLTVATGVLQTTTCALPQTLAPAGAAGATYQCEFTVTIAGNPGLVGDALTLTGSDDEGNVLQLTDTQSVEIKNVLPTAALQLDLAPEQIAEPGGRVYLTATVTNQGLTEPLFLTALETNLSGLGSAVQSSCTLPQTLAPGAAYHCVYDALVTLGPGDYSVVVTATVTDDDGSVIHPVQTALLTVDDVPAAIEVTLDADRTTLAEPGADVNFAVVVKNTSPVDTVVIEHVTNDVYGDLAPFCATPLPATLAPGATVHCDFVGTVSGPVGSLQDNEVTATGIDDDGNEVMDRDQETIEITDVPAQLEITQVANPANLPEPGGIVTFTATIRNISLTDNVLITKVETNEVVPLTGNNLDISTSCSPSLPADLPPNGTVVCRFTKRVMGAINQRHTSTIVVSGIDDENIPLEQRSREAIDIIDVPSSVRVTTSSNPVSVPEAGATVTFTVKIKNTSKVDNVTITSLINEPFGDLTQQCPLALPMTLIPGQTVTCTFAQFVSGDVDVLLQQQTQVGAIDDDGMALDDSTQNTIGVTDTPSSLKVFQLATPTGVIEPGGPVTFTVFIENTSSVDDITIDQVTDSLAGEIGPSCTPQVPVTVGPGARIICQFMRVVAGNANALAESTITITGEDDDAVAVSDFDLIQVAVLDAAPQSTLIAAASPNEVLETGDTVTMTVTFINQGPEITTLLVLSNTIVGDLNGQGTCTVPQSLAAGGGSYSCVYQAFVDGVAGSPPANVVYAVLVDDEGNERSISDEADLFLLAVAPDLQHTKSDELLVDLFEDPADEGKVSPGDTLRYLIQVRNEGNGAGQQVILTDTPDRNSSLIVGTVITSRGTILQGNKSGDQMVTVLLGDLGIGETATVQFDVLVLLGTGTTLLRNQAFLTHGPFDDPNGANVSGSDDPNTPFLGDPTETIVFIPPTGLEPGEEPVQERHALFLPIIQGGGQ